MTAAVTNLDATARTRRSVVASVVGNSLEWYDFFLYSMSAALVFGTVFFPVSEDPLLGTMAAFAGNAVGFAARPLGGIFFGHLGDRIGRKPVLFATLLLMGGATFLIGLIPSYATIGVAAPILLVTLRILQGIAAGGEWGGGMLLISENAAADRRGFLTAFSQSGVAFGYVLATLVTLAVQQFVGDAYLDWGWRIPFLLSAVIFGVGTYIRFRLPETKEYADHDREVPEVPLRVVLVKHWKPMLVALALRLGEAGTTYLFLAFALVFATASGVNPTVTLWAAAVAMLIDGLMMPVFGALSDRFGRRPVYFSGVLLMLAFAYPFFLLVETTEPGLVILAFVIGNGVAHAAMIGVQPAYFSELFPPELRYSAVSFAHEIAAVVGGGLLPLYATYLLREYGEAEPVAILLGVTGLICAVGLFFARETAPSRAARGLRQVPDGG